MGRMGFHTERLMLIDIIGDQLVSGKIIYERLKRLGLDLRDYNYSSYNQWTTFNHFLELERSNGIIKYDQKSELLSAYAIDNSYCLTKSSLREYKLNKILNE